MLEESSARTQDDQRHIPTGVGQADEVRELRISWSASTVTVSVVATAHGRNWRTRQPRLLSIRHIDRHLFARDPHGHLRAELRTLLEPAAGRQVGTSPAGS